MRNRHYLHTIATLALALSLPLYANIDDQIEAIQKAPLSKRFKLMNAFKQELIQMKEEEQLYAIKKLKNIHKNKYKKSALKELEKHIQETKKKLEKHIEDEINNETEDQIDNDFQGRISDED
jgi:biopolymer transport protein ExbB/TolQ